MTDLALNWASDLQVTPSGDLVLVTGEEETIQRITRRLLTTARQTFLDGTATPADYIWDASYGVGLRAQVGKPFNQQTIETMTQIIINGVAVDAGVNNEIPPTVKITSPSPTTLNITINFTTINGSQQTINLQL